MSTTAQNVLLILTDEQRFDALGVNGNPHIQTPNLDRFAGSAVNFKQHRVSSPICTPSRASILTGQYPRTHGALHVGFTLNRRAETLARWLSRAGYATGLFGKSHLEPELSDFNAAVETELRDYYGFDTAQLSEDNPKGPYIQWITREHPQWLATAWKQANEHFHVPKVIGTDAQGRLEANFATDLPPELSQSAWITRQTEKFVRAQTESGKPFFAVCSYVPPHHPWTPPRCYMDRYNPAALPVPDRNVPDYGLLAQLFIYNHGAHLRDEELQRLTAAYYALCTQLDECIGHLLQTLKDCGAADNTVVIFSSDHGDHLGERSMIRKSDALFENVLRVPLMVRVPGATDAGGVCNDLTQHEDLAPTVLDLLGLPAAKHLPGVSFAGALRSTAEGQGSQPSGPMARSVPSPRQYQYFEYSFSDHTRGRAGVGDGRYKLARYLPEPGWVLVDLQADPTEMHNLANSPDHRVVLERLQAALLDWLSSTGLSFGPKAFPW